MRPGVYRLAYLACLTLFFGPIILYGVRQRILFGMETMAQPAVYYGGAKTYSPEFERLMQERKEWLRRRNLSKN